MFAQTFLSFVSSSFLRTLSEHFSLPLFYRTIKSPLRNYINQRDVSPPRCIASLIAPRFAASSPSLGLGDSYTTWRTYVTVVNCDRGEISFRLICFPSPLFFSSCSSFFFSRNWAKARTLGLQNRRLQNTWGRMVHRTEFGSVVNRPVCWNRFTITKRRNEVCGCRLNFGRWKFSNST